MATKDKQETRTKIDDINDSLTRAEMTVQKNKKLIMWICVGAAVIIVGVLTYIYAIYKPNVNAANTAYGNTAAKEMSYNIQKQYQQLDSATNAKLFNEILTEYEAVAKKHGHDGGNNATLMAAIYNYKNGDYQKALDFLKGYSREDIIIATTSKALEGDCLVNLDKFNEAIECYKEAVELADENPILAPYCMLKQAVVQRHLKNYTAEADIYKVLIAQYPGYAATTNINFEAALARAQANAAKK